MIEAETSTIAETVIHCYERIESLNGGPVSYDAVPTGFTFLDEITGGFRGGEMIVLASPTSMGKTALALNIAEQAAMLDNPTTVFSFDMSREQVVERLLFSRAGVDSSWARRRPAADEYERLQDAVALLYETPIYVESFGDADFPLLLEKARTHVKQHGVKLIVIDSFQSLSARSNHKCVSAISRSIKEMAIELQVPVLCLSQINLARLKNREGHRPSMGDLHELEPIEQDADVVMMLHREEYHHRGDPDWAIHNEDKIGVAEVIITKQRNGPTGTVRLAWNGRTTRFFDWSYESRDHRNWCRG